MIRERLHFEVLQEQCTIGNKGKEARHRSRTHGKGQKIHPRKPTPPHGPLIVNDVVTVDGKFLDWREIDVRPRGKKVEVERRSISIGPWAFNGERPEVRTGEYKTMEGLTTKPDVVVESPKIVAIELHVHSCYAG